MEAHTSPLGGSWLRRLATITPEEARCHKLSAGPHTGGSLFHGTNKKFDSFNISFAGARDWGDYGVGVYLSTTPGLAVSYAYEAVKNNGGGEPVVYMVQANLSNIANYDELMEGIRSVGVPENKDPSIFRDDGMQSRPEGDSRGITEFMTSRGFDSAMVGRQVVVYDPSLLTVIRVLPAAEAEWWG